MIIAPLLEVVDGQYAGGRFPSMTAAGSWGNSRYSTTRSTELHKRETMKEGDQ